MRELVERKVRLLITIGAASEKIASSLSGATEIVAGGEMASAVRIAHDASSAGHVVLLSPACASFDQYGNFEERGRHFESLVMEIQKERTAGGRA